VSASATGIQIVDDALGIGGDDAVADALQGDLRAFLLAEQRLLVQLALGDIEFDADQAQQAALLVDLGLGAADDPAPFAGGMAHAVQALEYRRLAGHVIANRGLHPRHVVGVHQVRQSGACPRRFRRSPAWPSSAATDTRGC
jgi:hypothetical protein